MTQKPSSPHNPLVRYELKHKGTEAGTGWFSPEPVGQVDFEDGLDYLRDHPNDEFLHRYMLNLPKTFGPKLTGQLIDRGLEGEPHLAALIYETCYLNNRFRSLIDRFKKDDLSRLVEYTPLIYIRWALRKGSDDLRDWLTLFAENIIKHTPLKLPAEMPPVPFSRQALQAWAEKAVSIGQLYPDKSGSSQTGAQKEWRPEETARRASERLEAIGLERSSENPNPASINPLGLQMKWHMNVTVASGRHHIALSGLQTSYGKGLTEEDARASCLMEVCERVSSFAGFSGNRTVGYKHGHELIHCSLEELRTKGKDTLDPNEMHLEIPYDNQPLYWMPAEKRDQRGTHPVHVPAQLVFLFCNLDETCLSDGMPSTGLASGNTLEEAKLSALLEIFERDAERVMPFLPERCFSLEVHKDRDPLVRDVLDGAFEHGVHIQFLNITTELGVPCYKAFIQSPHGEIYKGCAAHLDGKRAAISALLEVPYHPSWFRHTPAPPDGPVIGLHDLPDYSAKDPRSDLERLEKVLLENGHHPIYVDLTREDLDIPVVKALIPGLEFFPEFDQFSPLSLRQFGHYMKAFS